jgi:hypothetical protein
MAIEPSGHYDPKRAHMGMCKNSEYVLQGIYEGGLGGLLKELLRMYSVFHEISEITKEAAEGSFRRRHKSESQKTWLRSSKKTSRKFSSTSLKIPKELPSVEETLKILAGTLEALRIKWDLNPSWDLVPVREGSVCTLCF